MLNTETPSLAHTALDQYPTTELVNALVDDQFHAVDAVRKAGPRIAAAVSAALPRMEAGGRLVYAVCSLLPDEGEAQVAAALARHPGLRVEEPVLPGIEPDWITPEGGLRTRPDHWADRGGLDGFFMARLRKAG